MDEKEPIEKIDLSLEDLSEDINNEKVAQNDDIIVPTQKCTDQDLPNKSRRRSPVNKVHEVSSASIPIWLLPFIGIVGAIVAWGVTEISYNGFTFYSFDIANFVISTDLYIITISGLLGASFGVAYGILETKISKAILGLLIGLLFGIFGGVAGGAVGNAILLLGNESQNILLYTTANGIAWGLVGVSQGLSQGLLAMSRVKASIIGGLLGCFFGGLFINVFYIVLAVPEVVARGIGICFLGFCLGLGLSMPGDKS